MNMPNYSDRGVRTFRTLGWTLVAILITGLVAVGLARLHVPDAVESVVPLVVLVACEIYFIRRINRTSKRDGGL